jgi:hypothetical protein
VQPANPTPGAPDSPRYRLVVLAMLVLVYAFNFIDRQIVGILAVPIKADHSLIDTQLGLMGGLAFALFYTALGIPIAMLANRSNCTLFLVPTALGLVWLGPALSAIQHVVPPGMRATASAIFLFVNNLIGIGLGSVALGVLSDALSARHGADSLRHAILAGTLFYFVAAALFLLSAKRLELDWE